MPELFETIGNDPGYGNDQQGRHQTDNHQSEGQSPAGMKRSFRPVKQDMEVALFSGRKGHGNDGIEKKVPVVIEGYRPMVHASLVFKPGGAFRNFTREGFQENDSLLFFKPNPGPQYLPRDLK